MSPIEARMAGMAVIACANCGASLREWSREGTRCDECRAAEAQARFERELDYAELLGT
jgi:hypothetical protein